MVEPVTINLRYLSQELELPQEQVQAVASLLDEGFPVPFIARYRKDATNNLDEDILRRIEEEVRSARALCERKMTILKTIESLGKLTPELDKKIREAKTSKRLEDLYLPFKPKKQTLASTAKERGLGPLAMEIFDGVLSPEKLDQRASEFIDEDKKVHSVADALLGAGHIIAEVFSEKIEVLQGAREHMQRHGKIATVKIETKLPAEGAVGVAKPVKAKKKASKKEDNAPVAPSAEETTESVVTEPVAMLEPTPTEQVLAEPIPSESTPAEPAPIESTVEAEDHSGAGGGEEEPVVAEPIAETPADPVAADSPVAEVPTTETPEESQPIGTDADIQAVTEQFQQWKEGQEEQGIPVVKSQNTLKKKKREEARKKKVETKAKQQEHFHRQFSDYFDYSSALRGLPAHRILAINRGERSKVLRVKIEADESRILESTRDSCIPKEHGHAEFLGGCLKDALQRLVLPAMERERRNEMTEYAENHAIRVFAKNLRNLLLQPPLHRKRVLALDPGYRNGCKIVPLDEFGNVLDFETVYLVGSAERKEKAVQKIAEMIRKYQISVIAIGNGTACRETEEAVGKMIAEQFPDSDLAYIIVNEAGASVYSASPIAKEEFPNYDVLLRGAVSIGRRLQDPLNELVKIDPASLGVGMYQHDLKGKHLRNALTEVVESCVNYVGVDLNTATPAILRYVSGLNQLLAKRIYDYRVQHGPFRSREDLKNVPGFGPATFTHAAGFLKIFDGTNPLDATWIHPESYELAGKILEKLGFAVDDLKNPEKVKEIGAKIAEEKIGELATRFAAELGAGLFTVRDILEDLSRPRRDPRTELPPPIFKKGVLHLDDLKPGTELMGTVLNVVDFGAFVDIGLHDAGLIHISQMADRYIQDAHDKVSVGDIVRVWVVEVDPNRKRISLTMLPPGVEKQPKQERRERHPQGEREERPRREPGESGGERRAGQTPRDAKGGGRRDGKPSDRGGDRRDGGGRRDRDRDRNRGPKTYVATPKEKNVKPITEDMKKGKEPLRSFGDLAQLLGRVQVPDPEEEKRRKKEEERKRREKERKAVPPTETPPTEATPES